jgi:nucleoside-diphosphate-sugar epimerase
LNRENGSGERTKAAVAYDVVELYRLAIAHGRPGGAYHAVAEEIGQRNLGGAISRMIGAGDDAGSVALERMHELGGTRGLRHSINKRLSADRTQAELGWSPARMNALDDVEFGSYADRPGTAPVVTAP